VHEVSSQEFGAAGVTRDLDLSGEPEHPGHRGVHSQMERIVGYVPGRQSAVDAGTVEDEAVRVPGVSSIVG
jgi:hypothetical protein